MKRRKFKMLLKSIEFFYYPTQLSFVLYMKNLQDLKSIGKREIKSAIRRKAKQPFQNIDGFYGT